MNFQNPDHPLWGIIRVVIAGAVLLGVMAIFAQEFNANEWGTAAVAAFALIVNWLISFAHGQRREKEFTQTMETMKKIAARNNDKEVLRYAEDSWRKES